MSPSADDYAARTGAAVVVQSGNLVIAGGGVPAQKLVRSGLADEFLAREPINCPHIAIDFGSQRNCLCQCDNNFFVSRRNNSRATTGPTRQFAAAVGQER